ncbi:MAG: hypothetical protein M1823_002391 [Watsoniomyces obsoletus]|nr:MAG: hypothetical protein M1823_002391 [Watsoniomyces obsoletus]
MPSKTGNMWGQAMADTHRINGEVTGETSGGTPKPSQRDPSNPAAEANQVQMPANKTPHQRYLDMLAPCVRLKFKRKPPRAMV